MDDKICFLLFLLQIQVLYKSEAGYCQEAVDSADLVASCPASKIEWDDAACKKNCGRIASEQNCAPVDNFRYHCVINSYRNETLEVCAPSRIVFGHCVEFNLLGGVIQDQLSSPCNDTFPKCGHAYNSTAAFKCNATVYIMLVQLWCFCHCREEMKYEFKYVYSPQGQGLKHKGRF